MQDHKQSIMEAYNKVISEDFYHEPERSSGDDSNEEFIQYVTNFINDDMDYANVRIEDNGDFIKVSYREHPMDIEDWKAFGEDLISEIEMIFGKSYEVTHASDTSVAIQSM